MKTYLFVPLFFLYSILFSSCATQNMFERTSKVALNGREADSIFFYDVHYSYTLQKDDKINISVWDNDDLSVGSIYGIYNSNEVYGKWLMLDDSGYVSVPKLGRIRLGGLTIQQARTHLTSSLAKWIVNPIVDIKVLNKEATVLGELKTPGKYLLEKESNTLLDLIGKAGDFDFYADKRKVQIMRMVNGKPYFYTADLTAINQVMAANIQIHPGDVVYVPARKGKNWDKRSGSVIVPIATAISAAVLLGKIL